MEQHTEKNALYLVDSQVPKARAARLRRLRNMANLSRYDMCDHEALNINTYKGWEIARYGGLPSNAAEKVIKRLSRAGVICAKEWLLAGTGSGPYLLPQPRPDTPENVVTDDQLIIKEITAFTNHYHDVVYTKIIDDTMLPYYHYGNYVAGIRKYHDEIDTLINAKCIVLTDAGELIVRYLKPTDQKQRYHLFHTNLDTIHPKPVIYDVRLEYAAKIVRYYAT